MEDTLSVTAAAQSSVETTKMTSMSVKGFKALNQESEYRILVNPNTQKLFVVGTDTGKTFKCEQAIDTKLAITVLIPVNEDGEQDIANACFINERNGAEVIATL